MLRNYLYIDEAKLDSFAQQIRTTKKRTVKRQKKVNLSITGLGVELSEEDAWQELSTHEKVEVLLAHLETFHLVDFSRPLELLAEEGRAPRGRPFILETMLARRVIIPDVHLHAAPGLKHLAVWVSDPDPSVYTNEEWTWRGTFVYLTELWLDDGGSAFWSGCSALQAIVNAAQGEKVNAGPTCEEWEPFGRGSYDHPVRKLGSINGTAGDERWITALYTKRHVTNEQCYTWNGEKRRVNEVLGYPIFIAEAAL
jgi:hypothetical protein